MSIGIRGSGEEFLERQEAIDDFAKAIAITRLEDGGVSIEYIAKCFKAQFDEEELKALINF